LSSSGFRIHSDCSLREQSFAVNGGIGPPFARQTDKSLPSWKCQTRCPRIRDQLADQTLEKRQPEDLKNVGQIVALPRQIDRAEEFESVGNHSEQYYVPGLGLVTIAAAIFCVGLPMYPWLTRKLLDTSDALLRKTPPF
jgi:hypothetical protein